VTEAAKKPVAYLLLERKRNIPTNGNDY